MKPKQGSAFVEFTEILVSGDDDSDAEYSARITSG
jgi:hypothetical protein